MKKSIKLFKLFGIDIEIHYSWFFVFLLLAWGLSSYFFPESYPSLTKMQYWTLGIVSSLFLFASVLIHELSHSLVAKKFNIGVSKITLFFFGGIANITGEEKLTPKKEFSMAIAGPLASLAIALGFWLVFSYSSLVYVKAISHYLYTINFVLALFNMAPGYPLDGGRVLRSVIWGITKDVNKATKIASTGGKIVAGALVVYGFFTLNMFMIGLGVFLYFIAGASYEQMTIRDALANVKVGEVMIREVKTVNPELSLADLFQNFFLKYGAEGAMVAKDKVFLGVITVNELKKIPKQRWPKTKVKDVLINADKIPAAKETDKALAVLSRMTRAGIDAMPVIKNKKLVGAVSTATLVRYAKLEIS